MNLINSISIHNLKGDIYGGLTAAVVALPLAMGMGVASGVGPMAGIYGAVFVGLFAALFGGTPSQVSGPTGPMTVVMAVVFTHYTSMYPDNPSQGAAIAFTVVMLGGLFQILFGILKLGRFISLIPHPVVSGFMTGIGVIIIFLQLEPMLGLHSESKPLSAILAFPDSLHHPVWLALALTLMTLAIVYLLPARIARVFPAPLLALVAGSVCLYFIGDGQVTTGAFGGKEGYFIAGVPIIGNIPSGLPDFIFPDFEFHLLPDMIKSGLILAALGSIDSLLTSLVADNITRDYHKPNRELIGQGIGNTLAGCFGGIPGAGATMRTVVNVRAGGRTPISGMLHALILLAIVLGLGALAMYIPIAVLAGILIKVGTDIIDWDYLKNIHKAPRSKAIMMFTVLGLTVFVDLIMAVAIGMVMAAFVFMQRMTELQISSMNIIRSSEDAPSLTGQEARLIDGAKGQILIYQLGGARSFTSAATMLQKLSEMTDYKALILDLSDVPAIDFTTASAFDEIFENASRSGHHAYLCGANKEVDLMLHKHDSKKHLLDDNQYSTCLEALEAATAVTTE